MWYVPFRLYDHMNDFKYISTIVIRLIYIFSVYFLFETDSYPVMVRAMVFHSLINFESR